MIFYKKHIKLCGLTRGIGKCGNYCLTDKVEQSILNGVTMIQLSQNQLNNQEFMGLATEVKKVCDKHDVPMLIEDNVDVAFATDAHGIYVSDENNSIHDIRVKLGEDKIIGTNTKGVTSIMDAVLNGVDFVAVDSKNILSDKGNIEENDPEYTEKIKFLCQISPLPLVVDAVEEEDLKKIKVLLNCNLDGIATNILNLENKNININEILQEMK